MRIRRNGRDGTLLLVGALALLAAPARAQVEVHVRVPSIRFEVPPPLVVVSEGVQVVPDHEQEVFASDGWYWYRTNDVWYRTRDHRGGWVVVERRYVPVVLTRIPAGKYRHHRGRGSKRVFVQDGGGRVTAVKVKGNGKIKVKEKRGKGRWK
jgi:hypothetical protein